jgi:hypothetical protein
MKRTKYYCDICGEEKDTTDIWSRELCYKCTDKAKGLKDYNDRYFSYGLCTGLLISLFAFVMYLAFSK